MPHLKDPVTLTDPLVTKREVADALGCQVRTLERYISKGQFPPPIRVGGSGHCLRWRRSTVERYLEKLEKQTGRAG